MNCPKIFSYGYRLFTPFLPARTIKKISVHGAGEDFLTPLSEYVDLSEVPRWLGGKSKEHWPYGHGGPVVEGDAVTPLHISSAETVTIEADAGNTITFEFCLDSKDIDYSVSANDVTTVEKTRVFASGSWIEVVHVCEVATTLSIKFDNSYSWLTEGRMETKWAYTTEE